MKRKALFIAGGTILLYEALIIAPEYTLWLTGAIIALIIAGLIQRHNTSYSVIATSIIIHTTLIFTLTLTMSPFKEHAIALFASILTFFLLEPEQQAKQVETKGRNETIAQRLFQGMLLIIMLLWYNGIAHILGELSIFAVYQILASFAATAIVTFHIQKTIAAPFKRREAIMYAIVTSFILAQITWITSLWPFTYPATALTETAVLFALWSVIESDMKRMVTLKRLAPPIIIASFAIAAAILSGPWQS